MEMTAPPVQLDFPHPLKSLVPSWRQWFSSWTSGPLALPLPTRRFQLGGWPWFGPAAVDEDLMPWGRSSLSHRPDSPSSMDSNDRPDTPKRRPFHHIPVLLNEVVDALQPVPGRLILDGTLGGGGHSEALLKLGARVVGMDQDDDALQHASTRLRSFGDQFCALHGNFRRFPEILHEAGVQGLEGILVDLGVSSYQLDEPSRGFSFQTNGPLDLRMDPSTGRSAADLVNTADVEELTRIFREFGEEPRAWHIANMIIKERQKAPFETTLQLAEAITHSTPGRGKKHPATLVFQGLRIAVNDELGALADFLQSAAQFLNPGGRLAVISFHSIEDRMVKQALRHQSTQWLDRPEWPEPKRNPDFRLHLVTRKSISASPAEIQSNPRARSARLRVAERLPHVEI